MTIYWSDLEGLTVQQRQWLDEFAHGLITPESFPWIVELVYVYAIRKEDGWQ